MRRVVKSAASLPGRFAKGIGFSSFGTLELLTTLLFVPIAIGLVVGCYAWATYYEVFVWQEPLETLRRSLVDRRSNSDSALSVTYYSTVLATIINFFSWIVTACAVGVYSWIRLAFARRFAKVVISSIILVQFVLVPPISAGSLSLSVARCICLGLSVIPSLLVFVLICRLRPIREAKSKTASKLRSLLGNLAIFAVVLGTLALSASGWRAAQANEIFNLR